MGSQFPDQESNLCPLQWRLSPNRWTSREALSILTIFKGTGPWHKGLSHSYATIPTIHLPHWNSVPVLHHLPAELTPAAHSGVSDKTPGRKMTWSRHHRVIQNSFTALNISRAPHLVLLPYLPNPWQPLFFFFLTVSIIFCPFQKVV